MDFRGLALVAAPFVALGILLPSLSTPAAGPFVFPHRPHLRAGAADTAMETPPGRPKPGVAEGGKADADCRVCHDFKKGPAAHLEGCAECHMGEKNLKVVMGPPASPRRPFPHLEHLADPALTCFSCHRPLVENDWVEFTVPPPGLEGGAASCASCHASHEPRNPKMPSFAKTGDGKDCASCHRGAASIVPDDPRSKAAVRPFLHEDHGGKASRCEECHAGVAKSRDLRGYDAADATAKACVACHVADAAGKPLAAVSKPPRTSPVAFRSVEGFSHPAHMEPAGRIPVAKKVTGGCATCHYPAGAAEPGSRAALLTYESCVACHDNWKVEGHGVGGWSCFKCHDAKEDRPGHLPLGVATVERPKVKSIAMKVHPHPGITTSGPSLASPREPGGKDCRECHLGRIPALESRLSGKGFVHEAHLPAKPVNADCLRCHPSAGTAAWSEDLASFDPASCAGCHTGAGPGDLGIETTRREVRQFDHASHATPKGEFKGLACVECHEPGGATGYVVRADALDCAKCHSHDPAKGADLVKRTGPKTNEGAETSRCLPCHSPPGAADAPPFGGAAPVHGKETRTHLDLMQGKQWHDLGGGCASCHERDAFSGKPSDYRERISEARVLKSIHEDAAFKSAWFNRAALQNKDGSGDPEGKKRTCATCHRQDPRGYLRELGR